MINNKNLAQSISEKPELLVNIVKEKQKAALNIIQLLTQNK
jgi:hypothetical protein